MVMKKKAQAAMEFLMTYGWAILVVLVVIGALAYFGVLNPQNLLPEKCTLPMGLYCRDHIINGGTPGSIALKLENGMGSGIMITNINISGQILNGCTIDLKTAAPGGVDNYNNLDGWHIANGDMGSVTITCTSVADFSGKTKGDITLTYCADTSADDADCIAFSHTMEGELMARVE